MAQYDYSEVKDFAGKLYLKANFIVTIYTVLGVFIGMVWVIPVALGIGALLQFDNVMRLVFSAISLIILSWIGGYIGYTIGDWKSFQIKMQAQTILCLAQIENNTRIAIQLSSVKKQG